MPNAKAKKTGILFVRMPTTLLDALEALAEKEMREHPGRRVNRSDIARELLTKATTEAGR